MHCVFVKRAWYICIYGMNKLQSFLVPFWTYHWLIGSLPANSCTSLFFYLFTFAVILEYRKYVSRVFIKMMLAKKRWDCEEILPEVWMQRGIILNTCCFTGSLQNHPEKWLVLHAKILFCWHFSIRTSSSKMWHQKVSKSVYEQQS